MVASREIIATEWKHQKTRAVEVIMPRRRESELFWTGCPGRCFHPRKKPAPAQEGGCRLLKFSVDEWTSSWCSTHRATADRLDGHPVAGT